MFKFALNRPVGTLMIFLSLIIFGIYSLRVMPVNLFPNIEIPLIKITSYANGDIHFIETEVSKKIEDAIYSIEGIDSIRSISYSNVSVVIVKFKLSKDIEVAANDIRDKLSDVKIDGKMLIEKLSGDSGHVMSLFINSKHNDKKALMDIIKDKVKPFLEHIDGVGKIEDVGYLEPQIRVFLDINKLDKYSFSADDISKILKTHNFKAPLGKIIDNKTEIYLKGDFEAENLEDLSNVRIMPGVFLSDVATIKNSFDDNESMAIMDSKEGVLLDIIKVNGANSIKTIDNVSKKLDSLKQILGNEFEYKIAFDKKENILKNINQVFFDMSFGVVLTMAIVFFFLRNFTSTIIATLSVPVSIIGTFFIIYILGYDLNRLTLVALTLGIGIFIDDAIVVIENISKKLKNSKDSLEVAFNGVKEISFSVLGISTVLLCVFIPMGFMDGIVGRYFESFALSVAGGIVISFFVSMMLIPMLASRFVKTDEGAFYKKTEFIFVFLENLYEKILNLILKFKAIFIVITIIIIAFTGFLAKNIGVDFLPMEDNGGFYVNIEADPGVSLENMKNLSLDVLKKINSDKENVEYCTLMLGYNDAKEAYKSRIYVKLVPLKQRKLRQKQIINKYRNELKFDGLNIMIADIPIVDNGGIDEPVQLVITGDEFEKLDELSNKAKEIFKQISGVVDIKNSSDDKVVEISITLNKEKAKKFGVNPYDIANVLRFSFASNVVGNFTYNNITYDISMRLDDNFRQNLDDLKKLQVKNSSNDDIYISSMVDFIDIKSPANILHYDKKRQSLITANIQNIPLNKVTMDSKKELDEIIKDGYEYKFTGYIELMEDTNEVFITTIAISAILMYIVLASLYESFILPIIIMITMPLAFSGVAIGLYLTQNNFSLFVMIGMILLFGMVGKNAILVVDFANRAANDEQDLHDAILKAGKLRLRAILMTTFAMIFAMLPLAFSKGVGYEGNSPMAICIICGLISSTILTLLVVPAMFGSFYKLDKKIRKIYERDKI